MGCSWSLKVVKGCEWARYQRERWGWGQGVGSSVPLSCGKHEPDAYLWRQESWSGTLSRATRPEFNPPVRGGGMLSAPIWGAARLCPGLPRAQKAASVSRHTPELTPGLRREQGGREAGSGRMPLVLQLVLQMEN